MKVEEYRKIINMAVGNEIEAYDFYKGVAAKVKDSNLKAIFTDLAEEEKKHKAFLESYLLGEKQFSFDETKDYRVSESVDKPKLTVTMKPKDAIALAMKNEEEAMVMYSDLAARSKDSEQKKMFESLSKMEKGHKTKLEDLYTNMAFPEAW